MSWVKDLLGLAPPREYALPPPPPADAAAARRADCERGNESVLQGAWGEDVASAHFARLGWKTIARNVHPCRRDRRCELDLIVQSPDGESVAFVEVKTHKVRSPYASRLAGVDRRKKANLLRACAGWLLSRQWHGNYRFDVVEVYGSRDDPTPPEIDHVENVPLFPPRWRFR